MPPPQQFLLFGRCERLGGEEQLAVDLPDGISRQHSTRYRARGTGAKPFPILRFVHPAITAAIDAARVTGAADRKYRTGLPGRSSVAKPGRSLRSSEPDPAAIRSGMRTTAS